MEGRDNFLANRFSYAFVGRANLKTIEKLKQFIAEQDDITVVFQKISTQKLWIKEGNSE